MLTKAALVLSCACLTPYVLAADMVADIDLEKVNWPLLCEQVGPVVFEQNDQYCEVSHPASVFHNETVLRLFTKQAPNINICDTLQGEYTVLTQPQINSGDQWQLCKLSFKTSFTARLAMPELYIHKTDEWKNAHFNHQTMRN
jgi:uncharacterized protein with WD repeat